MRFQAGLPGGNNVNTLVGIDGGSVNDNFSVNNGAVVQMTSGMVSNFATVNTGGLFELFDGTVGNQFDAVGGRIQVSGGTVGNGMSAESGGEVAISGGTVGLGVVAGDAGVVRISGGTVGSDDLNELTQSLSVIDGGVALVSGGLVGKQVTVQAGGSVSIQGGAQAGEYKSLAGSTTTLIGDNFVIDGQPVDNLPLGGAPLAVELSPQSVLSGVYQDGTAFTFSPASQQVPEDGDLFAPGTLFLARQDGSLQPPLPGEVSLPEAGRFLSLRAGQTLRLSGGQTLHAHATAGRGSTTIIESGATVLTGFEAVGASVVVEGGTAVGTFSVLDGANLVATGGDLGGLRVFNQSSVHATGGSVRASGLTVVNQSVARIDGGRILTATIESGSFVELSGGASIGGASEMFSSALLLEDGVVGDVFKVFDESLVIVRENGAIGERAELHTGSSLFVEGGTLGDRFEAKPGTLVQIEGGQIGERFNAESGSVINISGGVIGDDFDALFGSEINISGGSFLGDFDAFSGSEVNIFGQSFSVNGVPISNLPLGEAMAFDDRNVTLSGVLANGEDFSFTLDTDFFFNPNPNFAVGTQLNLTRLIPGDYNHDGAVNELDYAVWRDSFETLVGSAGVGADGNFNGFIDTIDYAIWRTNLEGTFHSIDVNADGQVDEVDLDGWDFAYGFVSDDLSPLPGDADLNGAVNGRDFLAWQQLATQPSGSTSNSLAIPEPQTAYLLLLLTALASGSRSVIARQ
ncbi:MAG: hypothetical protein AAGD11_03315 [Planctomycetota bacterium]